MNLKQTTCWILIGLGFAVAGCAMGPRREREIVRPIGCDERLARPEKRMECRACVERPRPHAYFPDRPEGDRCLPVR